MIRPREGDRFIGTPQARGHATLADHAIGIITHAPSNPLDEEYEFRVLWREPVGEGVGEGPPVEVAVIAGRHNGILANRFLILGQRDAPPAPYTMADFALLEQHERAAYESAGFRSLRGVK